MEDVFVVVVCSSLEQFFVSSELLLLSRGACELPSSPFDFDDCSSDVERYSLNSIIFFLVALYSILPAEFLLFAIFPIDLDSMEVGVVSKEEAWVRSEEGEGNIMIE